MSAVDVAAPAREPAWLQLGRLPDGVMTADEALRASGLDWTVSKQPLQAGTYRRHGARPATPDFRDAVLLDDHFLIRRDDTGDRLGYVGRPYQPFQNHEAFAFLDELAGNDLAKFVAALPLRGGRWVAITMELPELALAAGGEVTNYVVFIAAHDGTKAITAMVTPVVVRCTNTLTLALRAAKATWSVRHLGDVGGKLEEAMRALGLSLEYVDAFQEAADQLARAPFDDGDYEAFIAHLRPPNARQRDGLLAAWEDDTTHGRDTRWDALMAVTEYSEWGRAPRTPNAQLMSTWFGDGARLRARAYRALAGPTLPWAT